MTMEKLNELVREHEIETPWEYQDLARTLHQWIDIFNGRFFEFKLPQSFLRFEQTRGTTLGHYRPGRNDVGALYEVNINPVHLQRPLYKILCTLLHEMAHQWQDLYGKPGQGGYHNREFVRKCQELGIPCRGGYYAYTLGYTDPFVALLKEYGVDVEPHFLPLDDDHTLQQPEAADSSKLKRWACGCTNIWAAKPINLCCKGCGQRLVKGARAPRLNAKNRQVHREAE